MIRVVMFDDLWRRQKIVFCDCVPATAFTVARIARPD